MLSSDTVLPAVYAEQFITRLLDVYPLALLSEQLQRQMQERVKTRANQQIVEALWKELPVSVRQAVLLMLQSIPVLPATAASERTSDELARMAVETLTEQGIAPIEIGTRSIHIATPFPWQAPSARQHAAREWKVLRPGPCSNVVVGYASFEAHARIIQDISLRQSQQTVDTTEEIKKLVGEEDGVAVLDLDDSNQPTNEILRPVLEYAVAGNASDVHFSSDIDPVTRSSYLRIQIRFGALEEFKLKDQKDGRSYSQVLKQRFVALSNTTDKGAVADGKFRLRVKKTGVPTPVEIDVRFSSVKYELGYHSTLRLLDKTKRLPSVTELFQFAPEAYALVRRNMREPDGILLSCGPTGSGKTTLLNVVMDMMNTGQWMIYTGEDPVEYQMPGIAQFGIDLIRRGTSEKNQDPWLLLLKGLLRKDLDVLLLGEIRDHEVAKLCIEAAITGHQVYSTLHANSVCNLGERLHSMGVRVQEFAFSLRVALSQRLVRRVCRHCSRIVRIESVDEGQDYLEKRGLPLEWAAPLAEGKTQLREASKNKRCPVCSGRGYQGVVACIEAMDYSDSDIQQMIADSPHGYPSSFHLRRLAEQKGWPLLPVCGLRMIYDGTTDLPAVEEQVSVFRDVERCNEAFKEGKTLWRWDHQTKEGLG